MKTLIIFVVVFAVVAVTGFGFQDQCKSCKMVAEPNDLICKNCGNYLNRCMICGQPNPVRNDSCEICCNPLVESRILSSIDPAVREELQLGKSPRAILDRENSRIRCFLRRTPDQEARLLFDLAMNLKRMKFFAREAEAWGKFLTKFPLAIEAGAARHFRSEAFQNWGYLFFLDGNLREAETKFRAAIKDDPQNTEALLWLGRVNLGAGRIPEARHALRAVLALDPGDNRANYLLKADPKKFRAAQPVEGEKTALGNPVDLSETAQWFPENSVYQLK
jgi:tetratricopeptide (TPR) repeat protein